MTFDLQTILVLAVAALVYGAAVRGCAREWALLLVSVVAVYWLQPPLPIRHSDFLLPTATIVLAASGWWWTCIGAPRGLRLDRGDTATLAAIVGTVLLLGLTRYAGSSLGLTASRPPSIVVVAGALAGGVVLSLALRRVLPPQALIWGGVALAAVALLVLKSEPLAEAVAGWWRAATGRDSALASQADLGWLGFSYVAFRLIHTFRDRLAGVLPAVTLREYVCYVIFFPAYTAGPIDRVERFTEDLRALPALQGLDVERYAAGLTRIGIGLLKKFVIADLLATGLALNATNAADADSALGLWVLLYGYALRLYFDFGGYTDIAVGLGMLFGVTLPENFSRPYTRTTITSFWQSWHITLSGWARAYVFSPLSRWMLMRDRKPPGWAMVLVAQVATMLTIGLWHGVTANFAIWGLWHAGGLFVHKLWSDRTRRWYRGLQAHPRRKQAWTAVSWFVTLHFVVLGWVWFVIPDPGDAVGVFGGLVGAGP